MVKKRYVSKKKLSKSDKSLRRDYRSVMRRIKKRGYSTDEAWKREEKIK